jgi:hypothetical protein
VSRDSIASTPTSSSARSIVYGPLPRNISSPPGNDITADARAFDAWDYRGGEVVTVGSYLTLAEARANGRLVTRGRSVVVAVDLELHEMERRAITDAVMPGLETKYLRALASARTGDDVARAYVDHRLSAGRLGDRARHLAWRRAVHRAAEVSPWDHTILRGAIEDLDTHPAGRRP